MPALLKQVFRHRDPGGGDWEFAAIIEFPNGDRLMPRPRFCVAATVRRLGSREGCKAAYAVEADLEGRCMIISCEGGSAASLPLDLPLPDQRDCEGEPIEDAQEDDEIIESALADAGVADLESLHPGPLDPALAGLLEGAVSTLIAQILRCWMKRGSATEARELSERTLACLWEHRPRLARAFSFRAGRCLSGLGW